MSAGAPALVARAPEPPDPPMVWGEVSDEHLRMTHYAPDSSAAAVILGDYGYAYFEDDGDLIFERHTRIKILTEGGYGWGDVTIPYYAEDKTQRVRDVDAQTYHLGPDGRTVTTALGRRDVFDEDVDGQWKQLRFTLPALQPGAVIEYRYRIISAHARYLPSWTFQWGEPVLWSEYRADIPEIYRFVSHYQGALQPGIVEEEPRYRQMHWAMRVPDPSGARRMEMARVSSELRETAHRWVMQAAPALREEPFMTTPEDYRARLHFQLAEIRPPAAPTVHVEFKGERFDLPAGNMPSTPVMTSWEQLADELLASSRFGGQLDAKRALRREVEALVAGAGSDQERLVRLYDHLRTTVVWSGRRGVLATTDVDDALAAKEADGPEIALLLASMLRAAGLEAHPVLISTRSHGKVHTLYPLLRQFNSLLVYAEAGGEAYLLDATDPQRPHTLLPAEALNGVGWLVRAEGSEWIAITAPAAAKQQVFVEATLDAAGTLTATVQAADHGYSALEGRQVFAEAATPEHFVREHVLAGGPEAQVDQCAVDAEAAADVLRTEATITVPGYALAAGDFLYVAPVVFGRTGANPLRLPERTFPVDLAYPQNRRYTLRMAVPEGYAVDAVPENVRVTLPGGGGYFQRLVQAEGGVVVVQSAVAIEQTVFEPAAYPYLRAFFDRIVAAEADQVVLRRLGEGDTGGHR